MSNKITLKKSSIGDKVPLPGDLEYGELALNYTDGNLFYKNSSNVITAIASNKFVSVTGNVTGGNINISGIASVTGAITSASTVSGQILRSTNSIGNEGGEIQLSLAASNTTLSSSVTIDVYQNKFRIFETGGTNRGAYIDLSLAAAGAGTNLLSGGTGGTPGGANTQIQFNDNGSFGGSAGFTFDKTTNSVSTTGTISSSGNLLLLNSTSNFVGFSAPATITSNVVYKLPSSDGNSGQVLKTNGTGGLSWGSTTGSFTVGTRSSGSVIINTENGFIDIVGRTGIIAVPVS